MQWAHIWVHICILQALMPYVPSSFGCVCVCFNLVSSCRYCTLQVGCHKEHSSYALPGQSEFQKTLINHKMKAVCFLVTTYMWSAVHYIIVASHVGPLYYVTLHCVTLCYVTLCLCYIMLCLCYIKSSHCVVLHCTLRWVTLECRLPRLAT